MTWHDTYSPYAKYTGRCLGRLLHFLYHYCYPRLAEEVTIGFGSDETGTVMYGAARIASFTWDDDVPVFNFFPPDWSKDNEYAYDKRDRDAWTQAQQAKRDHVRHPLEYRRALANRFQQFMKSLQQIEGHDRLMDSRVTQPLEMMVRPWVKFINALPIDELQDYIWTAKLYEAVKQDKTSE